MAELLLAASPLLLVAILLVVIIFAAEVIAALFKTTVIGIDKAPSSFCPALSRHIPPSHLTSLGWLGLYQLPFLLWLAMFLSLFAVVVLSVNALSLWLELPTASWLLLSTVSVIITSLLSHYSSFWLASMLYQSEHDTEKQLTGASAVITMNAGYISHPTEAKLQMKSNKTRYLLVEPVKKNDVLKVGDEVTLLYVNRNHWVVKRI